MALRTLSARFGLRPRSSAFQLFPFLPRLAAHEESLHVGVGSACVAA
jgi:hypothetical protein